MSGLKEQMASLLAENYNLRSRKGAEVTPQQLLAGNDAVIFMLNALAAYGVPGATKQQVEAVLFRIGVPEAALEDVLRLGGVKNLNRRGAGMNFILD